MQQMAYAELEVALSDSRALAATPFVSQHPGVSGRDGFRVLVLRTGGVTLECRWSCRWGCRLESGQSVVDASLMFRRSAVGCAVGVPLEFCWGCRWGYRWRAVGMSLEYR